MPILTLTTDLGIQDQYVAAIKGSILALSAGTTIVDISHHIPDFDYFKAAYVLKNSFYYYPDKTVHFIGVNPFSSEKYGYLAALYKNHFFIYSDSGLQSALFDEAPQQLVRITGKENPLLKTFSILDLPVKAAAKLLNGGKLTDVGEKAESFLERNFLKPYVSENTIDAYVTHIDKFSNLVTDIDSKLFYEVGKSRPFKLYFKNYTLKEISAHYEDAIQGEIIALFNFQGFLEIAMNYGTAALLTNVARGEKIKIIFDGGKNS